MSLWNKLISILYGWKYVGSLNITCWQHILFIPLWSYYLITPNCVEHELHSKPLSKTLLAMTLDMTPERFDRHISDLTWLELAEDSTAGRWWRLSSATRPRLAAQPCVHELVLEPEVGGVQCRALATLVLYEQRVGACHVALGQRARTCHARHVPQWRVLAEPRPVAVVPQQRPAFTTTMYNNEENSNIRTSSHVPQWRVCPQILIK